MDTRFGFLAACCSLGVLHAQATFRPQTPQLHPYVECIERPANLGNTPLVNYVPDPWAYFSIDSSEAPMLIFVSALFNNLVVPVSEALPGQPGQFYPGYDRAPFSVRLGIWNQFNTWSAPSITQWFLSGASASVPAYGQPQTFCTPTLVPAIPIISNTGTTTNQLLATMIAAPPSQLAVTVDTYAGSSIPFTVDSQTTGNLSNLYYLNGSIYGDITPDAGSPSPVSWYPIRVRSGGTVLAFGHMPVMAVPACAGSIAPGTLSSAQYRSPYSQTFSLSGQADAVISSTGALPPGLTLSNGALSGTPSVAGAFPFTLAAMPSAGTCAAHTSFTLTVSGPSCAVDITSQVAISFGGLKKNLATGQWNETITFQNTGAAALAGPVDVVLNSLSAGATLVNASGFTNCFAPSGMPYVSYPSGLAAGASGTVTLTFTTTSTQPITFTPRIAAGGNQQ